MNGALGRWTSPASDVEDLVGLPKARGFFKMLRSGGPDGRHRCTLLASSPDDLRPTGRGGQKAPPPPVFFIISTLPKHPDVDLLD